METHTEGLSPAEAAKIFKTFNSDANGGSLSSASLAEILSVPEQEIVSKLHELRARKRNFVDRGGIVSAAIAFALVIGFVAAKSMGGSPLGLPSEIRLVSPGSMTVMDSHGNGTAVVETTGEASAPAVVYTSPKPPAAEVESSR